MANEGRRTTIGRVVKVSPLEESATATAPQPQEPKVRERTECLGKIAERPAVNSTLHRANKRVSEWLRQKEASKVVSPDRRFPYPSISFRVVVVCPLSSRRRTSLEWVEEEETIELHNIRLGEGGCQSVTHSTNTNCKDPRD